MIEIPPNKIGSILEPISNLNVLTISEKRIGKGGYNKWIKKGTKLIVDTLLGLIFKGYIQVSHNCESKYFLLKFLKYEIHHYSLLPADASHKRQHGWLEGKILEVINSQSKDKSHFFSYKTQIVDLLDLLLGKEKEHHCPGSKLFEVIVINDNQNWTHEYHSYLSIINIHRLHFQPKSDDIENLLKDYNLFEREIARIVEENAGLNKFIRKLTRKIDLQLNSRTTPDGD